MPVVTLAEVAEGVKATIAAYAQALDDGRTDDLVDTFCPDGACDIPGVGAPVGHAALGETFAALVPRHPQRHLVVNTLVTGWDDQQATAVSDFVFLLRRDTLWQVQVAGRYHDTFHHHGDRWRFHRRTVSFVPSDPSSQGAT